MVQCWSILSWCSVGVFCLGAVLEYFVLVQCWSILSWCSVGVFCLGAVLEYHVIVLG